MFYAGPSELCRISADVLVKEALAPACLHCKQVGRIHQLPAQSLPRDAPLLGSRRPAAPQRQRRPGQDDRARLLPAQLLGAAIRGKAFPHASCMSAGWQTFKCPAHSHPRHATSSPQQTPCNALGTAWPLREGPSLPGRPTCNSHHIMGSYVEYIPRDLAMLEGYWTTNKSR